MLKRISAVAFLSLGAMYYAQDASVIKNTAEIYSSSDFGGTAKFNSMAGSMGALGGDLSAITINPAGTGVFISGDVAATLSVQNNKNNSNLFGSSFESSYTNTNLGQIGGVVSFDTGNTSPWKFVNLAFNYSTKNLENYVQTPGNSNISTDVQYTDSGNNTIDDKLVYTGHAYDRTGTASNLNVSLGGNYENKIYLGAGLNFKSADFDQSDFFQLQLQDLGESAYYQKQYTPYRESSNGFSASVGIIGKINNNIRLGVAVESPTFWNLTRTYTEYSNYSNGIDYDIYDETRKLTTPMKLTLSGAIVASKNFAINVDYTLGVTKPKYKVEGSAETQLNDYFSSDYKNTSDLRVGAEYRVAGFRLRGGYGLEASPFSDSSIKAINSNGVSGSYGLNSPFVGKRETLAGGLGYDFKAFYIDAGIQSITSTYDNPFFGGDYAVTTNDGYSVTNGDSITNEASIVSKVKNAKTNFFLTVGWKF
ncbi:OmpP1/FadL family transporter [Cloacibacterium sp.]|uniref:OmpP1/FadL family transporter n=1 Tax=Cloacibacterium sp. TaxID=1913682 RepID=UPI0039E42291